MTARSLLILFVVTAVSVAGTGWAWWAQYEGSAVPSASGGVMFPALSKAVSQVATVGIKSRSYALKLARKDAGWVAADRGDYPVLGTKAERLIADIASLTMREAKTRDPKKYVTIGVDDPGAEARSVLVRVAGKDGAVLAELLVGKPADSVGADPRGATFVRRPGEAQSWLAEGPVTVPVSLSDWLEPLLHVPGPDMRRVRIEEHGKTVFEASRKEGEARFQLVAVDPEVAHGDLVTNDAEVKNVTQAMVSATFADVRPDSEVTFADGARTIIFDTADGTEFRLRLGQADGNSWISVHVEAPDGSPAADTAKELDSKMAGWAYQLARPRMLGLHTDVAKLVQPAGASGAPGGGSDSGPSGAFPGLPPDAIPGPPAPQIPFAR